MYTDGRSVLQMLTLIHQRGTMDETRLIGESLMQEMTRRQSATPTRTYGLGLVILNRPEISPRQLVGHQGFAYGCVDGAFIEEGTGRAVVFLNGGASEARTGRLGLVNRLAPEGAVCAAALELAQQIVQKPFESLRLIKRGVRELWLKPTQECFYPNLELSKTVFQTEDCAEGVDAFLNKRKPQFR